MYIYICIYMYIYIYVHTYLYFSPLSAPAIKCVQSFVKLDTTRPPYLIMSCLSFHLSSLSGTWREGIVIHVIICFADFHSREFIWIYACMFILDVWIYVCVSSMLWRKMTP